MAAPSTNTILHLLLLTLIYILHHLKSFASNQSYFPVTDFGARLDGRNDATEAFLNAWKATCQSDKPSILYAPPGLYSVGTLIFNGPCRTSKIGFRIDGTLRAFSDYTAFQQGTWILFNNVNGLSIYGGGSLDGQGEAFWACKGKYNNNTGCPEGVKTLSIGRSSNVKLTGLKSFNSKFFHIFVWASNNIVVEDLYLVAPENSPNTDGIHVQQSSDIIIRKSFIKTGDDCISIGPGTYNVLVESIYCGPGHGISIGSLGQYEEEPGVRNVTVKTVDFYNTMNGVRIKTWGRPSNGYVSNVVFRDITMSNVTNPIIIDQNYCPWQQGCPHQNSGIKISKVIFNNIRGSSANEVGIKFECSPSQPCRAIQLKNVKLTYNQNPAMISCRYVFGNSSGLNFMSACMH